VAQNAELGHKEEPVLPSNERQMRPLIEKLKHDGERIHVWAEVANSGEKKITAELVQRTRGADFIRVVLCNADFGALTFHEKRMF